MKEYYNDSVIRTLIDFADSDDNIRAVMLEGSRAFGEVDQYSDYDVVFVTVSNEPYFNAAIVPFLIKHFGEIAVMQIPDDGDPYDVYALLIQFTSGIRIDLTFKSIEYLGRDSLESATVILMDKDGLFANSPPPSDADFWLKKPSQEEFYKHCNQFWWCTPYVAKAVHRGQTLYALGILGEIIRNEYCKMLSYLAGTRNNWDRVNVGKHSTNIKKMLAPDDIYFYEALMKSYVQADGEQILAALDLLMSRFDELAQVVAKALGYVYDLSEAQKTMTFIREKYAAKYSDERRSQI